MAGKQSTVRTIVNRNVERHLVKEFLMANTKRSGFGALDIRRTPQGTEVTVHAERPGMVIGRKGKIINELQKRLNEEFDSGESKAQGRRNRKGNPQCSSYGGKDRIALERGWYYRRAGHSAAQNIMDAGARGVIVTVAGKLTGSRNRTQKFILGHVKYCGETALQHMDVGYSVAVKKLGTIGCTVAIMRPGTRLPHEISIFSEEDLRIRAEQAAQAEAAAPSEASE